MLPGVLRLGTRAEAAGQRDREGVQLRQVSPIDTKSYVFPLSKNKSMVPMSSTLIPWCSSFFPAAGVMCICGDA